MAHEIENAAIHRLRIVIPDPDPDLRDYPTTFEATWEPLVTPHGWGNYWHVSGSDSGTGNYMIVYADQIDGLIELLTAMRAENRSSERG